MRKELENRQFVRELVDLVEEDLGLEKREGYGGERERTGIGTSKNLKEREKEKEKKQFGFPATLHSLSKSL